MIDFSRLKTLEQVQTTRARLEREVETHQQHLMQDVSDIHISIRRKRSLITSIIHAIGYVLPKPNTRKTFLGIVFSSLVSHFLRRRKARQ